MNKKELIRAISQEIEPPISQEKVAQVLDTAVSVIKRTLDAREPVKWSGFGTLAVKNTMPKRLYSPVKKEYIMTRGIRKVIFVEPRKHNTHPESMSKME